MIYAHIDLERKRKNILKFSLQLKHEKTQNSSHDRQT